jgi:hypothetical protein
MGSWKQLGPGGNGQQCCVPAATCSSCLLALLFMQAESEQTNSALALGVCIGRDLRVKSAGGYLVQVCNTLWFWDSILMPGALQPALVVMLFLQYTGALGTVCLHMHSIFPRQRYGKELVIIPVVRVGYAVYSVNKVCLMSRACAPCCMLLQVLPFCSDETLDQLEQNLTGMPSMTQLLNQGLSPQEITDKILAGLGSGGSSGDTIKPRYPGPATSWCAGPRSDAYHAKERPV